MTKGMCKLAIALIERETIPVTESGCWIWIGSSDDTLAVEFAGNTTSPERLSYEAYIGPVPSSALITHKCHVSSCVNPNHLLLGEAEVSKKVSTL